MDIYKNQFKTDLLNVEHYVSVHSICTCSAAELV